MIFRDESGLYRGPQTIEEYTEVYLHEKEEYDRLKNASHRFGPLSYGLKGEILQGLMIAIIISFLIAVGFAQIFEMKVNYFGDDKFRWLLVHIIIFILWMVRRQNLETKKMENAVSNFQKEQIHAVQSINYLTIIQYLKENKIPLPPPFTGEVAAKRSEGGAAKTEASES